MARGVAPSAGGPGKNAAGFGQGPRGRGPGGGPQGGGAGKKRAEVLEGGQGGGAQRKPEGGDPAKRGPAGLPGGKNASGGGPAPPLPLPGSPAGGARPAAAGATAPGT